MVSKARTLRPVAEEHGFKLALGDRRLRVWQTYIIPNSLLDNEIRTSPYATLFYFFFNDDAVDRNSGTKALSTLMPLFNQEKLLTNYAIPGFNRKQSSLPEIFSKLWTILTIAATDPQAGHMICALDALDKCGSMAQTRIVDELVKFYSDTVKLAQINSALRLIVTSWPYYDTESECRHLIGRIPTVQLPGDGKQEATGQEIDLVINARAPELEPKLGHSEQALLRK
jgi:hypothetical protein